MAGTFTNHLYHIAFSTKNRENDITKDKEEFLDFLHKHNIKYNEGYI